MQSKVIIPQGEQIQLNADSSLKVPNQPIIPFIEGDGIGVDVTPAMQTVIDAAVEKAYGRDHYGDHPCKARQQKYRPRRSIFQCRYAAR